ncbi:MAG: hypothetical protein ACFFBD_27895, partial [Candidatus Hodarchaeota archaeon]
NKIPLSVVDAVKQSAAAAREELNQIRPRSITQEDIQGIQDYLLYWGAACISGGTLLNRGISRIETHEGTFLLSFRYLPKKGMCALMGREDKNSGEKEKSLFGLIKKQSSKLSNMKKIE